jgi:hypothetical protein
MFIKATEDQPESWFVEQAKQAVKDQLQSDAVEILEVTYVRNVAQRKNMYCVKFKLPFEFLAQPKNDTEEDYAVAGKRRKIEE